MITTDDDLKKFESHGTHLAITAYSHDFCIKLLLFFVFLLPQFVFAQERPPVISYQGRLSDGRSDTTGINEDRLNLMVPLMKFEDGFLFMPLTYSRLRIRDQLKLDTGTPVAQDFTKIEGVLQYIKNYSDESNVGFRGSYGYAGDKTLGATNDNTFSLGAHYSFWTTIKIVGHYLYI